MEKHQTIGILRKAWLLLALDSMLHPLEAARAAGDAGVRAVEVPVSAGADTIAALVRGHPDVLVGAAGVDTAQRAWDVVAAGARFMTAAPLTPEIAAVCDAADVAVVAAVAGENGLPDVLALRPDFVRLAAAPAGIHPEWPPLIVDALRADPESVRRAGEGGAVVAVSAHALGAASPDDLRRRLEALVRAGGTD